MPNLVKAVTNLVAAQNKQAAELFEKDFSSKPQQPQTPSQQKKALNNYLRVELSELPLDTAEVRSFLIDQVSIPQWLEDVESHVVPLLSGVWYNKKTGTPK